MKCVDCRKLEGNYCPERKVRLCSTVLNEDSPCEFGELKQK